ncbi:MAG: hypothetical protein DME98_12095 [Verrucomicrobia bacterium]|nr:MAG: hypothetical protein DME98_12095 [Verrucomicrobiota bacterium]PYJ35634.1 MAG: hypothetical protein DME88_01555 [Verrucomicrobiota bacterium]
MQLSVARCVRPRKKFLLHATQLVRLSPGRSYAFSAKGAAFIASPPQEGFAETKMRARSA